MEIDGEDMFGECEPYVQIRVGSWVSRTESGDKLRYAFRRGLEIKYADEEFIEL